MRKHANSPRRSFIGQALLPSMHENAACFTKQGRRALFTFEEYQISQHCKLLQSRWFLGMPTRRMSHHTSVAVKSKSKTTPLWALSCFWNGKRKSRVSSSEPRDDDTLFILYDDFHRCNSVCFQCSMKDSMTSSNNLMVWTCSYKIRNRPDSSDLSGTDLDSYTNKFILSPKLKDVRLGTPGYLVPCMNFTSIMQYLDGQTGCSKEICLHYSVDTERCSMNQSSVGEVQQTTGNKRRVCWTNAKFKITW